MATASSQQTEFDPALSLARQTIYRFLSWALSDPRAGTWEQLSHCDTQQLVRQAAEILRSEPAAANNELALGERPLTELDPWRILARLPKTVEQLNDLYEKMFGLLVSCACPPCETEYINSKLDFRRSHNLADVGGFYRAFGLKPVASHPERQDHIVLELEFMAFLIGLERQADGAGDVEKEERIDVCRQAQKKFLEEHLAWWTPAFCRLLGKEGSGGLYESIAEFLSAWIAAERSLLDVAASHGDAKPSAVERPEECEGCMLAS